jgi:carbonic anhydrase
LRDLKPILYKKQVDCEILIVGAVYNIHTGKIAFLEETLLNFPQSKK